MTISAVGDKTTTQDVYDYPPDPTGSASIPADGSAQPLPADKPDPADSMDPARRKLAAADGIRTSAKTRSTTVVSTAMPGESITFNSGRTKGDDSTRLDLGAAGSIQVGFDGSYAFRNNASIGSVDGAYIGANGDVFETNRIGGSERLGTLDGTDATYGKLVDRLVSDGAISAHERDDFQSMYASGDPIRGVSKIKDFNAASLDRAESRQVLNAARAFPKVYDESGDTVPGRNSDETSATYHRYGNVVVADSVNNDFKKAAKDLSKDWRTLKPLLVAENFAQPGRAIAVQPPNASSPKTSLSLAPDGYQPLIWDPKEGHLFFGKDQPSTQAFGLPSEASLLHEIDHGSIPFWTVRRLSGQPDPVYDTAEEKRIITGSESAYLRSRRLPERADHQAYATPVASVDQIPLLPSG